MPDSGKGIRFAYKAPKPVKQKDTIISSPASAAAIPADFSDIYLVHVADRSQPGNVSLHSHPFIEILYICQGTLSYYLDSHIYEVKPGDILVIPGDALHKPLSIQEQAGNYERYVLWVSHDAFVLKQLMPELDERIVTTPMLIRPLGSTQQKLRFYFEEGERIINQQESFWKADLSATILQLLVYLYRSVNYYAVSEQEKISLVDKIIIYIDQHIGEDLSLSTIANQFSISVSYLERICQNQLGMSIHSYTQQRRIDMARKKILAGETIEEVCYEVGFRNYSTFYRAFVKYCNCSPSSIYKKK